MEEVEPTEMVPEAFDDYPPYIRVCGEIRVPDFGGEIGLIRHIVDVWAFFERHGDEIPVAEMRERTYSDMVSEFPELVACCPRRLDHERTWTKVYKSAIALREMGWNEWVESEAKEHGWKHWSYE